MLYEKQSSFSGSKNNQWIDRLLQGQIQSIQLVFCTEAPSLGALFPPLVIQAAHRDRRRREIRCKKKKKKWWNHPLAVLILTHRGSGEYCTSQWHEGQNRNKCSQASMNCLSNKKEGRKAPILSFFLPLMGPLWNVLFGKDSIILFLWVCFSWVHCQLWWAFMLLFWFCFCFGFF